MSETRASEPLRQRSFTWSDPGIGLRAARDLSGLEFVRGIGEGRIPPPPIMDLVGFRLESVAEGKVAFAFTAAEYHYNPMRSVHGGIVATLLDSAMGLAVLSTLATGMGFSTLEMKLNFTRALAAETGEVLAEGRILHGGGRVITAESRLADTHGRLYAHGSCTCLVLAPA